MKLRNTTHWPDYFLRRMLRWVCQQIELAPREINRAEFGKRASGCWNGRAWWSGRIRVVIGPADCFPVEPYQYPGTTDPAYLSPRCVDQLEGLIAVTAHEATHIRQYRQRGRHGKRLNSERPTRFEERRVLELFKQQREQLVAEWSAPPPAKAKTVITPQVQRAAKALRDLTRWQRKLKLAQTKVKQYKRRVNYYDSLGIAASPGSKAGGP